MCVLKAACLNVSLSLSAFIVGETTVHSRGEGRQGWKRVTASHLPNATLFSLGPFLDICYTAFLHFCFVLNQRALSWKEGRVEDQKKKGKRGEEKRKTLIMQRSRSESFSKCSIWRCTFENCVLIPP